MFTRIDASRARDDRGVGVRLEAGDLRYECEGRVLTIPLEYHPEERRVVIYESSVRAWDTPGSGEIIHSVQRRDILRDVSEALGALGVAHRILS